MPMLMTITMDTMMTIMIIMRGDPNMPKKAPEGDRQTLMFSATFPDEVQESAQEFLHDYLFVTIGLVGGACSDVRQEFHEVPKFEKRTKLEELMQDPERDPKERTLIFVQTKKNADFLATYLSGERVCPPPASTVTGFNERGRRHCSTSALGTSPSWWLPQSLPEGWIFPTWPTSSTTTCQMMSTSMFTGLDEQAEWATWERRPVLSTLRVMAM